MAATLNVLESPVERCLLRKGPRLFGLLGKATPTGLAPFGATDVAQSWALTAEWGCLRLERLTGTEEVTGHQLFLPTALCYDYGVAACNRSPAVTRAVFGLLSWELDKLVATLRRKGFPMLGFARTDLVCGISGGIIPAYWPHVVMSHQALYGNVISLETFVRVLVASMPEGHLCTRFPELQPVFRQMMPLTLPSRRGLPYVKGLLELAPAALAVK
jgi:hypothetical protein